MIILCIYPESTSGNVVFYIAFGIVFSAASVLIFVSAYIDIICTYTIHVCVSFKQQVTVLFIVIKHVYL